jgi:hypothetical protein
MRLLRRLAPGLAFAFGAACTASNVPTLTPEPVVLPSPTAISSASATIPIPAELVGEWITEIDGETWRVTLQATGAYLVQLEESTVTHDGAISSDGSTLDFFGGDPCSNRGSYEWSMDGETLTFRSIGEDRCPGRATVLDGHVYTRRN